MSELTDGCDLKIFQRGSEPIVIRFFGDNAKAIAEKHAEQILYEKKRSSHFYKIDDGKAVTPLIVWMVVFIDPTEVTSCIVQEAPSVVIQMPVEQNEKDV